MKDDWYCSKCHRWDYAVDILTQLIVPKDAITTGMLPACSHCYSATIYRRWTLEMFTRPGAVAR